MGLTDVMRFFGLWKQQDLIELLSKRKVEIDYELSQKTTINAFVSQRLELDKVPDAPFFGFTLSYPVRFNNREQFLKEKKAALDYDFNFLLDSICNEFKRNDVEIKLFNVQYKNQKVHYHFLIKGIDKKTNALVNLTG